MTKFTQFRVGSDKEENDDIRDFFKGNKIIKWELVNRDEYPHPLICIEYETLVTDGISKENSNHV